MRATWWVQATPGTTYWRCQVPAKRLPGQALDLETSDLQGMPYEPVFPRQQGASVWQFPGNTTRALLMAAMMDNGVRTLVEVDDDYTRESPFMRNASERSWYLDRAHCKGDDHNFETHSDICRFADGIICSTDRLANVYSDLNEHVYVCRNSVDPDDWQFERPEPDGIFRIGWAGSSSHTLDQHLVKRAMHWAAQQPNVEVIVFGGVGLAEGWKVRHVPWTDSVAEYRRQLVGLGLDVGICPLIPEQWAQGKSDVKALEYAMAGAMPIVSGGVEPYKEWRDRTSTCFSAKDWEQTLKWAVGHQDEVKQLAKQAKDYVLGERTIAHEIKAWEEALCVS